jgi:hypothetical protein
LFCNLRLYFRKILQDLCLLIHNAT